ncbi:hypothetical protein PPSIR1_33074 [Plesiocystis pacifica SIR-1]|uniref:Smr domain-containing protein n=1 Tax=Plesiocystis pacifica SIR-1 TaxID=391625 RepID=A6GJ46_9BACT|nr:Smr/MutS family protein [Plesiocystis pacifica]EDM74121.1 hypothetical protein PPSIR1_33074 [Plesiocystis pacifica SIR-1]
MAKSRGGKGPEPGTLGELLEPHAGELAEAAAARESREAAARAEAERQAKIRRLDEGQFMQLIYDNLDPDNPRVATLDFDRLAIVIVSSPEPAVEAAAAPSSDAPEPAPASTTASWRWEAEVARLDPGEWVGGSWTDDLRPVALEAFDRPTLTEAERALLRRAHAERRPMCTCNLRHMTRAPALHHLAVFVATCRDQGQRYCRVIPGKGISSEDEPVLKRALLAWCRESDQREVLAWAPELDASGEWGSVILELRAADA